MMDIEASASRKNPPTSGGRAKHEKRAGVDALSVPKTTSGNLDKLG
jgi:hypothetical protein